MSKRSPLLRLDYGEDAPDRRWWQHPLGWAIFAFWLLIVAATFGNGVWERASLYSWQQRCLAAQPPGDRVIYDEIVQAAGAASGQNAIDVAPEPRAWRSYREALSRGSPYWYESNNRSAVPTHSANLFLSERVGPDGRSHLVAVDLQRMPDGRLVFLAAVLDVSGPSGATRSNIAGEFATAVSRETAVEGRPYADLRWAIDHHQDLSSRLRFFAGQPDPARRDRFTIAYDKDGRRGQIEGGLDAFGQVTLFEDLPNPLVPRRVDEP